MVSGGAALVAASSVTGLSLAPAWGGLLFGKTFKGLSLVLIKNHLKNMQVQEQELRYWEEI